MHSDQSHAALNDLPPELLLQILRYAQISSAARASTQVIVSFARLAQPCVAPAQELLFRHCDLTANREAKSLFLRTLLNRPELGDLPRSIKILSDEPSISSASVCEPMVQSAVELVAGLGLQQRARDKWLDGIRNLKADAWTGVLLLLTPNVERFEIHARRSISAFLRLFDAPWASFVLQSVKEVVLRDITTNRDVHDPTSFLFQAPTRDPLKISTVPPLPFPSLVSLKVRTNELGNSALNQLTNFITPKLFQCSRITHFAIEGWVAPHFLEWPLCHMKALQSFTYNIKMPSHQALPYSLPVHRRVDGLFAALRPVRESLEHLELCFLAESGHLDFWPGSLQAFANLHMLCICGAFCPKPPLTPSHDVQIAPLLPCSLRHFILDPTLHVTNLFRDSWAYEPFQHGLKRVLKEKSVVAPELENITLGPGMVCLSMFEKLSAMADAAGVELRTREPSTKEVWTAGTRTGLFRAGFGP